MDCNMEWLKDVDITVKQNATKTYILKKLLKRYNSIWISSKHNVRLYFNYTKTNLSNGGTGVK